MSVQSGGAWCISASCKCMSLLYVACHAFVRNHNDGFAYLVFIIIESRGLQIQVERRCGLFHSHSIFSDVLRRDLGSDLGGEEVPRGCGQVLQ